MDNLKEMDLTDSIISKANSGIPIIGICLGMQLLFDYSEEGGKKEGLKLIQGKVLRLKNFKHHIGWNRIKFEKNISKLQCFNNKFFYFINSYSVSVNQKKVLSITDTFNEEDFIVSSVKSKNLVGLQFHPESQKRPQF